MGTWQQNLKHATFLDNKQHTLQEQLAGKKEFDFHLAFTSLSPTDIQLLFNKIVEIYTNNHRV